MSAKAPIKITVCITIDQIEPTARVTDMAIVSSLTIGLFSMGF